jgi:hypothetical protein
VAEEPEHTEMISARAVLHGNADLVTPKLLDAVYETFWDGGRLLGGTGRTWRMVRAGAAIVASKACQFSSFKRGRAPVDELGGLTRRVDGSKGLIWATSQSPREHLVRSFSHVDGARRMCRFDAVLETRVGWITVNGGRLHALAGLEVFAWYSAEYCRQRGGVCLLHHRRW